MMRLGRAMLMLACLAWGVIATTSNAQLSAVWTPSFAPGPAPRGWVDMLYDPVAHRTVLFAGSGNYYYNDIWSYDAGLDQWTQIEPFVRPVIGFTPPCGRDEYAFEYDSFNELYWSFGGSGDCGYLISTTQPGTTTTVIVDPTLTSTVPDFYKYWYVSVVANNGMFYMSNVVGYNPDAKTLELDPPVSALAPGLSYKLLAQGGGGTWNYNPATRGWASFDGTYWGYTGPKPITRMAPAFAYSSADDAMVMFGGEIYNDTWVLDPETKTWIRMHPNGDTASPPVTAEITNSMVYDSDDDVFILFGGMCWDSSRCTYRSALADTWVYKLSTNTWTRMQPAQSPSPRLQQQMAYDPVHHVVVMFGGLNGPVFNELWVYSYGANTLYSLGANTWTQIPTPTVNPGARYLGALTYDASSDQFILYGGANASYASASDVWKLTLSGTTPPTNEPPVAVIDVSPTSGTTATLFQFDGSGSHDTDGSIASYAWDFGDQQTSSQASPTHQYAATGTYTVKLTVTDNQGATNQTSQAVDVTAPPVNQTPVAVIGVSPISGTTATLFQFDGSGSYDSDGSIASYAWNFGDQQTSSQASPTHQYAATGTYTVKLTVTDNQGATNQTSQAVSVTAPPANQPPVAVIIVSPTSGTTATLFQFDGSGSRDTDGSIVSYAWDFGDQQTSSQISPTHRYAAAGNYTVKLTVTDNLGATNQTSLSVGVTVPPDTTPPTVQSLALAMPSPTMADTVTYTLTFSEPVTGVASGNFAIATSGITGASIGSISGSGATWTVSVSTGRNTGSLRLDVTNGIDITDTSGNPLAGTPFTGETYQIDKGGTVIGTGEGQPVATFGSEGYALFNDVQAAPEAGAIAVLSDGRVLAAGGIGCDPNSDANCHLQLARYSDTGVLDTTFGPNGRVLTAVTSIRAELNALILNADDTFFVNGSRNDGVAEVPFVAKFTGAGAPASSFGSGGVASLDSLPIGYAVTGSAIDASGRILVVGTTPDVAPNGNDIFVARLTDSGALDPTFGSGGVARFAVSTTGSRHDRGTAIAVQSDARIVVGGHTIGTSGLGFDFLLLRLDTDGSLDPSFGTAGVATTRFSSSDGSDLGRKLVLQSDGKIVLVGSVLVGTDSQCGIARFESNGMLDSTFGNGGQILEPVTHGCSDVTLQPDGKLAITANDQVADVEYGTLFRLLPTGSPDTGFGSTLGRLDISNRAMPSRIAVTSTGNLLTGLVIEDPIDGVWKSYIVELESQLVQPTITGFSPVSGTVGTSVVITGTSLTGASAVAFNGTSASYVVDSASQITGTVPAGATTGPIAVTTPGGTATSAATFTVAASAPTITGFSPASGPVGTSVTISGSNFTGATAVAFNGTSASYVVDSASLITATVPAGATTGPIAVTTPGGTATSAATFTVAASAPTITSFSPASGPIGTSVTIKGANLATTTAVTFNGTSASYTVRGGQIIATVPDGATTGPIVVTTPDGTATSTRDFAVTVFPTITDFTPASGPAGTSVAITGSNFTDVSTVKFLNNATAAFTVNSATLITATVPKNAKSGPISVTTSVGTATSASSFTVTK